MPKDSLVSQQPVDFTAPSGKKTRRAKQRKPIYVIVPADIEDVDAMDTWVPESSGVDGKGKKATAEPVLMDQMYHTYVIPPGAAMKRAVEEVLSRHNVDARTASRVKVFVGSKAFSINTQYNIKF
jgi:hypothetical protein